MSEKGIWARRLIIRYGTPLSARWVVGSLVIAAVLVGVVAPFIADPAGIVVFGVVMWIFLFGGAYISVAFVQATFTDHDLREQWREYVTMVESLGSQSTFVEGPTYALAHGDDQPAAIVLERPARFYGDSDSPFTIEVDGVAIGEVGRFERVTVAVAPGDHTIVLSLKERYRSQTLAIRVAPFERVTPRCIGSAKLRYLVRPAAHPPIKLALGSPT